jgi:hypothetical protein
MFPTATSSFASTTGAALLNYWGLANTTATLVIGMLASLIAVALLMRLLTKH